MELRSIIPVLLTLLFLSCGKGLRTCKDMELSIPRHDYIGSLIKVEGYFYHDLNTSDNAEVYFLYRNGIVNDWGSVSKEDAKNGTFTTNISGFTLKDTKYIWGVFQVSGNGIEIEHWRPIINGCVKTAYLKGEIQNDSTFVITLRQNRGSRGEVDWEEDSNDTFHFHYLLQKPDSTNDFVK